MVDPDDHIPLGPMMVFVTQPLPGIKVSFCGQVGTVRRVTWRGVLLDFGAFHEHWHRYRVSAKAFPAVAVEKRAAG